MAIASPLGLTRTPKHVYTWRTETFDSGPLPSVTGILNIVDKSGALVGWAKRETAACAVRNLDMLAAMRQAGGDVAAVNWLKAIPDYQRDTAADIGTRVHALAESTAKGIPVTPTDEERPFLAAFQRFLDEWQPRYLATEEMVASLTHRYAGTLDAIVRRCFDQELVIVDYKTGREIYPEVGLQLAAYARGEFMGLPDGSERRLPEIGVGAVLHLTPTGYEFRRVRIDDLLYRIFLHACEVARFRLEIASTVIGEPLLPDPADAPAGSPEEIGA